MKLKGLIEDAAETFKLKYTIDGKTRYVSSLTHEGYRTSANPRQAMDFFTLGERQASDHIIDELESLGAEVEKIPSSIKLNDV